MPHTGREPKRPIRIGVDLGKNYFQVHALESEDFGATTRKLGRQTFRKFFAAAKPCPVGMIPPIYVKPYDKRGKNDAAGAADSTVKYWS